MSVKRDKLNLQLKKACVINIGDKVILKVQLKL